MSLSYTAPSARDAKFRKLPECEDDSSTTTLSAEDEIPHRRRGKVSYFFLTSISILIISFSFWMGTIWQVLASTSRAVDLNIITQYSPILEDIPISYQLKQFNGSLFKATIFRGPAGPEVDAAWETLGVEYLPILVPSALAQKSGLRPDQVKVSDKYGGGYPANVEGLHHLHCLNLLRKALWYNFEYYRAMGEGAFENEPYVIENHVTHCLDILRQQLMCTIDVGVLGQIWYNATMPTPFVDFNTKHKCRDFDAIRQWAEERQATPPGGQNDWLEPPKAGDRIYDGIP